MNKKQKNLENKLGTWADQATLTRGQPQSPDSQTVAVDPTKGSETKGSATKNSATNSPALAARATYPVARSLMDRIADTANAHDMSTNQVIGDLLTWALDQVDTGKYQLRRPTAKGE